MRINKRNVFMTLKTEGGLIPSDLLQKIASFDKTLDGLSLESYHLNPNERINEAASRSWNRLVNAWQSFRKASEELPPAERGTTITRERWLLILFQELGYGRLNPTKAIESNGKAYPVSHFWKNSPIHLVGFRIDIDKRTTGIVGAARTSPHSLVQEFLNSTDKYLWGFVSNGLCLRILRNNRSLTRQAYVEFDLQAMMDGQIYSDFVMLWLLCHQSRVESEKPEECWLERWVQSAKEQGTRALDTLRDGVEKAIKTLGGGFIAHPLNGQLRDRLRNGSLSTQEYYRQLLRMVYRLIFLFVAEDRNLLFSPKAENEQKEFYFSYYSASRLRRISERMRGTKHCDLYQGLRIVMEKLGDNNGCEYLGLSVLGSFLWSKKAIPDLMQNEIGNIDFLSAIRELSFIIEGRILRIIDYRNLGSEELGSVYESLLELHPVLNIEGGSFDLSTASGHERKTTGSYYTPTSLINCLLDSALDPVVNEALKKERSEKALLDLKICDPACGSGHFLIAATHRLAKRLAAIRTGDDEPSPEAIRRSIRDVIGHCIYGVDINPMAVELCKVGLWMEALEPGKPLSFLDHRILCGNSLLGTTPRLVKEGISDSAFEPIEGDDKKYCLQFKKRNTEERHGQKTLFDGTLKPWEQLGNLATAMVNLEDIKDDTIEGIRKKQKRYEDFVKSSGYLFGRFLADAWCSAFVWKKKESKELPYPITEEIFKNIEKNPHTAPHWMKEEVQRLANQYQFFHWHIMFPDVFRVPENNEEPENKQAGWSGGFDVVFGNPPWEKINFEDREYFSKKAPNIAEATTKFTRKKMIEILKNNEPKLYEEYWNEKRKHDGVSNFFRCAGIYPLVGVSRINLYSIFAEMGINSINKDGMLGFILPFGIVADDNNKNFFVYIVDHGLLVSFYGFENRKKYFPQVLDSYRFSLIALCNKTMQARKFKVVFYAFDVSDVNDTEKIIYFEENDFKLLNPNTKTCPILRNRNELEILKKIYRQAPILEYEESAHINEWDVKFKTPFNMSNDSNLFIDHGEIKKYALNGSFIARDSIGQFLPVYEAKLIYQFDHRFATFENCQEDDVIKGNCRRVNDQEHQNINFVIKPRFWMRESEFLKRFGYNWVLAYRMVMRPVDDTRTLISAIIPKRPLVNSLSIIEAPSVCEALYLCALLNSFLIDFVLRIKMSGMNLNHWIMKQLPVLHPSKIEKDIIKIIKEISFRLSYQTVDLKDFALEYGYTGDPFCLGKEDLFYLRAKLDAFVFYLYKMSDKEINYILESFPVFKRKDEEQYGEYRTKRVILEIYHEISEAVRAGKPYQTRLDPPPADLRVANPIKDVVVDYGKQRS